MDRREFIAGAAAVVATAGSAEAGINGRAAALLGRPAGSVLATTNAGFVAGDSRATSTGPYSSTQEALRIDSGHQVWARQLLKGKFDFNHANDIGASGITTSTFISTYLPSLVTALQTAPGSPVLLTLGVNNTPSNSGITLAQSKADIDTITTGIRGAGGVIFWNDEWPLGSYAGNDSTHLAGIRDYIRSKNNPQAGFYSIPSWNSVATAADGLTPQTGYLQDAKHLATLGAQAVGIADYSVMNSVLPFIDLTARSGVLSGGNFSTSGGSLVGTLTGGTVTNNGIPSGWTLNVLGGNGGTITSSVLNNPNGDGINWWQIAVVGVTAPNLGFYSSADLSSGWVTNTDRIEMTMLAKIVAGQSNLGMNRLGAYQQSGTIINGALGTQASDGLWAGSSTTFTFGPQSYDGMLRMQHVLYPTGATFLRQRVDCIGIAAQVASFTVQYAMPQLSKYLGTLTD